MGDNSQVVIANPSGLLNGNGGITQSNQTAGGAIYGGITQTNT